MKIYHYCGGINFATRNIFKSELYNLVKLNPQKEVVYRKKLEQNVLDVSSYFDIINPSKIIRLSILARRKETRENEAYPRKN